MPTKKNEPKGKNGGARPGAGRKPKKIAELPNRAEVQKQVEELCFKYSKDAVKWLQVAAKGGDTGASKYLIDRVLGRPHIGQSSILVQLSEEKLKLEVELLKAQEAAARLNREENERRLKENIPLTEEGRYYPAGGHGVSVCGRYHAALDPTLYPNSPLLLIQSDRCVLCGGLAPKLAPEPRPAQEEDENDGPENEED